MSKVVKKVTRGIKKVVKGVKKGISKVWKKIKKNKIFRAVATAALVYFGGAALMGGLSGAGAASGGFMSKVGGFFSGAGTGVANAWSGLTGAASSALSGNFSQAGAQLGQGALGRSIDTVSGAITGAGGQALGTSSAFRAPGGFMSPTGGGSALAQGANAQASSQGLLGSAGANAAPQAAADSFWRSTGGAAAIMTGGQMVSGYAQGRAQEEMYEREQRAIEEERRRIGENLGAAIPQVRWNPETRQYEVMGSGTPSGATDFVSQSIGSTNAANRALYQAGLDPLRSSFEFSYPNYGRGARGILGY